MDFGELLFWAFLLKFIEKIQFDLKSEKKGTFHKNWPWGLFRSPFSSLYYY